MSIVLPVSNTVGGAGAGVAAGAVSTFNRTFSMTGALGSVVLNGDSVKIQGSTDGGATYQDLVVGAGTASSSVLTLQFSRPEAVINDACTWYRTIRLTIAPGSTMAAVGMNAAAITPSQSGQIAEINWSIDQSEMDGTAALTFTKDILTAAQLPAGSQVIKVISDSAAFVAFDDAGGTHPTASFTIGSASSATSCIGASTVANGQTGAVVAGTLVVFNQKGLFPAEKLTLTFTCGENVNLLTVGHISGKILVAVPSVLA